MLQDSTNRQMIYGCVKYDTEQMAIMTCEMCVHAIMYAICIYGQFCPIKLVYRGTMMNVFDFECFQFWNVYRFVLVSKNHLAFPRDITRC